MARDDNSGSGGSPFTDLTDTGDGLAGVRVVLSATIPWFFFIGNERVGSSLSIAVHPRHSRMVYLCWGDDAGGKPTLHVRRSTDRGATWSGDLVSIANATNPALAITESGRVGSCISCSPAQAAPNVGKRTSRSVVMTGRRRPRTSFWQGHRWTTPHMFDPYIGDYDDLQAVGDDLYGIFSAHNQPDKANFPHGVRYQRNSNFVAHQLLDVNGVSQSRIRSIPSSSTSAGSASAEENDEREEFVRIRGLRYERLEIDELSIRAGSELAEGWEGRRGLLRRLGEARQTRRVTQRGGARPSP